MMSATMSSSARRRVTLERSFESSIEEVWDLGTTKEGIESWWGPDGFATKVQKLDLRPGGELLYTMTAVGADQIAFMKNAGMPIVQVIKARYTVVAAPTRLAYTTLADFIPGIEPYDAATNVELHPTANGVRLVLTIDEMHDAQMTKMAVMGWESELGRLDRVLKRG
jgi:uncharacterized protein YndB with AHSA1/START domain